MEKIQIKNLTFTYPHGQAAALSHIDLTVQAGEWITLCGRSGCGKSTLLRHLKPILAPHGARTGEIFLDGKSLFDLSQREQAETIGFVFQDPESQLVTDKVWHELAFGPESLGCPTDEICCRVAETASFFGIQTWFHKSVTELSGGQKQLLNLAAVMVMQPSVLLLDEPTAQLDPIAAQNFLQAVEKLRRELGVTVILAEHRLEDVFPLSDRVVLLEGGKIRAVGSPSEIGEKICTDSAFWQFLPTPMRIYAAAPSDAPCPITVRDGRDWLCKQPIKAPLSNEEKATAAGEEAITLSEVWFRYEKDSPDVLRGLSLTVRAGELYAIVGGNGTGKTTTLSILSGQNRPYRGKISVKAGQKIAALPQDPKCLFVKNTVRLDLYEAVRRQPLSEAGKTAAVEEQLTFCALCDLADRHPYDLSGGEAQRAALAKVLLTKPDILLLDEPTKGMDAAFKAKFAALLAKLKGGGMAIIMVSHDIEFCAEHADRVGMFFDGGIVSEAPPRKFFSDKRFYTTAAARMAAGILPGAILDRDIIRALGGRVQTAEPMQPPAPDKPPAPPTEAPPKQKLPKRTFAALLTAFLLIPLTLYLGITYFGDRKYYLVSLLILSEILLPFAFAFEGRKPRARELVLISVLCAIGVAGRAAFAMLPQFKPVAALVTVTGVCFGGEIGFLVGAMTAFVSNFFFGQGPWTPWQMVGFGGIGFLAGIFFQSGRLPPKKLPLCLFGALATLLFYGGILNPASVLIGQAYPTAEMFLAAYAAGFPFDCVHALSTVFFLFFLGEPLCEKLERVKDKYGLIDLR